MAELNIPKGCIGLNFAWEGPNTKNGGIFCGGSQVKVIDFLFEEVEEIVCVRLPPNINPKEPKNLSFTRIINWKDFTSNLIYVTEDQIRNLTLQAGVLHARTYHKIKTPKRKDTPIALTIPKDLKLQNLYTLLVSSTNLSFQASLQKQIP
jgi:hypothetical protein